MVDKQKFHHPLAGLLDPIRIGSDDHAFAHRHGARRDRFRRAFHFDQAHAAIAGNRQPLVETKAWNFLARQFARLQNGQSRLDFDLYVVNGQLRHLLSYAA